MPLNVWYWILMALWLVLGLYSNYTPGQPYPWVRGGGTLLLFLLFMVLGIKVFGSPIQ